VRQQSKRAAWGVLAALAILAGGVPSAWAGENDLVLTRFGKFNPKQFETPGKPCPQACGAVERDEEGFRNLATDLGEVFAPRLGNPSDTLGEAGFAVSFMGSLSFIPADRDYWKKGVEDQAPNGTMFSGHLQLRKGLPFSFEIAGNMSYLAGSEMFGVGADLKWALLEGFYYMPDIAVRGSVNTVLGAPELNLLTSGWDVSISKDFGLGGVLSLAPYAGYQSLYIVSSSRLLNAYPQDPRSPQFDPDDPSKEFSPEFVFDQKTTNVDRFFLGLRLNVWVLSFSLSGMYGKNVNQFNFAGGMDF
jgi:hypothetical protein